jgi:hypothetical protein
MKNTSIIFKFCTFIAYVWGRVDIEQEKKLFSSPSFQTKLPIELMPLACFLVDKTARV